MQEVIEALDAHAEQEGVEVEVRLPSGSLDDMRTLVTPFAAAWAEIGNRLNGVALDPDQEDATHGTIQGHVDRGRSQIAHEILRMMAAAEHKVQSR